VWGVFCAACGGDEATPGNDAGNQDGSTPFACVPSESGYSSSVLPLIETYCASCHGETPKLGAPFSLTSYAATLLPDQNNLRPADHMIHTLRERIMPPANQPQPSPAELDALIRWASCNQASLGEHADGGHGHDDGGSHEGDASSHGGALTVSRAPVVSPAAAPVGSISIDVTLDEFTPPASGDRYQRKTFSNLVNEEVFIRRFEPIVDDERVVHHLTLRFGTGEASYLYIWAPGGGALEFPNGGIRFRKTDSLKLEVHYHNGAGYTDVRDSSGVRLYTTAPGGTEYGVANVASWNISVPPMGTSEASYSCTADADAQVFAALPHMHETGETLSHIVTRGDGSKESLVELSGWSFHQQQAYSVGMEIKAGDKLDLRCGYYNPTSRRISGGTATTDEMCFDFLYITPPQALVSCNDKISSI
jgi:hypothetical protein